MLSPSRLYFDGGNALLFTINTVGDSYNYGAADTYGVYEIPTKITYISFRELLS